MSATDFFAHCKVYTLVLDDVEMCSLILDISDISVLLLLNSVQVNLRNICSGTVY